MWFVINGFAGAIVVDDACLPVASSSSYSPWSSLLHLYFISFFTLLVLLSVCLFFYFIFRENLVVLIIICILGPGVLAAIAIEYNPGLRVVATIIIWYGSRWPAAKPNPNGISAMVEYQGNVQHCVPMPCVLLCSASNHWIWFGIGNDGIGERGISIRDSYPLIGRNA